MKESFTLKHQFNVSPKVIYDHWLSSEGHTAMTGGEANYTAVVGDEFDAWDGYIQGRNLELNENQTIIQSWRTSEFEEQDEDSKITIHLHPIDGGTKLELIHTNIPEGQTQYVQGWMDHYFKPMEDYFHNK